MSSEKYILLTGATGYIGSHTWVELLSAGYSVVGIDDFSNSSPIVLDRIRKITSQLLFFAEGDVGDESFLRELFGKYNISAVMHFAGLKAVAESTQEPLKYYGKNVEGLLTLLTVMKVVGLKNFIFSSSATVYDPQNPIPYLEGMPLGSSSPYGWTKLFCEQILRDLEKSDPGWHIGCLRYFNPIGAHPSGEIGEDPKGVPNNLMPFVSQVAVGLRNQLSIYGADWPTPDGTCIRDYIHVVDLAKGHLQALKYLEAEKKSITVNLGTGQGVSVIELVRAFEAASNIKIPHQIVGRRPGDISEYYADVTRARELLGWSAELNLHNMCADAWRWQSKNPRGYSSI